MRNLGIVALCAALGSCAQYEAQQQQQRTKSKLLSRTQTLNANHTVLRWSRFVRQAAKVDLMTKRMIHHEDTQTVHG
jgi:hypothetical protein